MFLNVHNLVDVVDENDFADVHDLLDCRYMIASQDFSDCCHVPSVADLLDLRNDSQAFSTNSLKILQGFPSDSVRIP